tara:strand:- start:3119 stop:3337 length:219 start_codon:yes stop_codon:yes gene_type:complete
MELDDYNAIGIAEGFVENPGTTPEEQKTFALAAWQYLINTGLCWQLQGWFGREARSLIEAGICRPPPNEEEK